MNTACVHLMPQSLEEYNKSEAWGISTHIDLHNTIYLSHSQESESLLEDFVKALCKFIKMRRYGKVQIEWFGNGEQEGYSVVQLIETSCITMHTTRENIYIDLFSCRFYDTHEVIEFCAQYFNATNAHYTAILRK